VIKTLDINLKEKAVIIADVHYKKGDKEFLDFLKKLDKNPPPQFILLGDIFHLLLPFDFLIEYNKEAIELINSIAKKSEVYYIIGNHDFYIDNIFKNVIIAEALVDKKKSIFLTHGDLNENDFFYKVYLKIIRNKKVLKIINIVTFNCFNNWLFKKILKKRVKCFKIPNFKLKVIEKIADINYNTIIEAHYHQNILYNIDKKIYINVGAFKCDKCYYTFIYNTLKEKRYGR